MIYASLLSSLKAALRVKVASPVLAALLQVLLSPPCPLQLLVAHTLDSGNNLGAAMFSDGKRCKWRDATANDIAVNLAEWDSGTTIQHWHYAIATQFSKPDRSTLELLLKEEVPLHTFLSAILIRVRDNVHANQVLMSVHGVQLLQDLRTTLSSPSFEYSSSAQTNAEPTEEDLDNAERAICYILASVRGAYMKLSVRNVVAKEGEALLRITDRSTKIQEAESEFLYRVQTETAAYFMLWGRKLTDMVSPGLGLFIPNMLRSLAPATCAEAVRWLNTYLVDFHSHALRTWDKSEYDRIDAVLRGSGNSAHTIHRAYGQMIASEQACWRISATDEASFVTQLELLADVLPALLNHLCASDRHTLSPAAYPLMKSSTSPLCLAEGWLS
jgi:hypothetical protein